MIYDVTRLVISMNYYFGPDGVAPNSILLVPSHEQCPMFWEAFEFFYPNSEVQKIIFQPALDTSYVLTKMHQIQWVQLDTEDVYQNDLWADYLPSKVLTGFDGTRVRGYKGTRVRGVNIYQRLEYFLTYGPWECSGWHVALPSCDVM